MKIQKIYQEILSDLETIDDQLKSKNGSQRLWQQMSVKYKLILPDIISVIKVGGKMSVGDEFDYRPELRQLKEAFLTWIFMNEDDITLISDHVENESKTILEATKQFETEAGIPPSCISFTIALIGRLVKYAVSPSSNIVISIG